MSELIEFDNPELQLAENEDCSEQDGENSFDCSSESEKKRQALEKTKIVKQTWSIVEIYQKVRNEILILSPDYQRNVIWDTAKRTSFVESLYDDIDNIMLEVNENNRNAISLYKRCGFEVINKRKNYYGSDTALIMKRVVDDERC